jgi:hypothetical protein
MNTSQTIERLRSNHSLNQISNNLAAGEPSREQSQTKGQANVEKVKKMQKELDSRKKLNKMLLKEIQKLKANEDQQGGSGKKASKNRDRDVDKTFNLFSRPKNNDARLNRSLLGGNTEKNEYLKGLESNLVDSKPEKKEALQSSPAFVKNKDPVVTESTPIVESSPN